MPKLNPRGFSLSELTVATAITAIVGLIMAALFGLASSQYFGLRSKIEGDQLAAQIEYTFRSVFSQAINIQFTGGAIPLPIDLVAGPGRIADVAVVPGDANARRLTFDDFTTFPAAPNDQWVTLATFLRESGTALAGNGAGAPRATALFYRLPSNTARKSGVLFLDLGKSPGSIPPTMAPGYDDAYFDRITLFELTKHKHGIRNTVVSVDFRIRVRFYRQFNGASPLSWCPGPDVNGPIASCSTAQPWTDVERQFSVVMRNNLVRAKGPNTSSSPGDIEARVLGGLYFFQPITPIDVR